MRCRGRLASRVSRDLVRHWRTLAGLSCLSVLTVGLAKHPELMAFGVAVFWLASLYCWCVT